MTHAAALAICIQATSWAFEDALDVDEERVHVAVALSRLHRAVVEEPDRLLALARAVDEYRTFIRALAVLGEIVEQFAYPRGLGAHLLDTRARFIDELGPELAGVVAKHELDRETLS
jgi:hypothetical protein